MKISELIRLLLSEQRLNPDIEVWAYDHTGSEQQVWFASHQIICNKKVLVIDA